MALDFSAGSPSAQARPAKIFQVVTSTFTASSTENPGAGNYTNYSNNLSVLITPSSASNKILLLTSVAFMGYSGRDSQGIVLYKDGTIVDNARGVVDQSRMRFWASDYLADNDNIMMLNAHYLDSPATTSQVRYTVGMGAASDGTVGMNRTWNFSNSTADARGISVLTAFEVAA